MNPAITVIIPVLNGMPYLPEMLASLEAQTFKDFTVLLWDNGSTDGTVEEAMSWIPSRLQGSVVSGSPLPLQQCLARMVEISETEFCARMDADDICHSERLRLQLDEFYSDPQLLALGTQAVFIDESSQPIDRENRFSAEYCDILSGMLVENQLLHPTVMFRRQAVLDAGNYVVPKPCEDYDLWMKVASRGKVRNLSIELLSYRIHGKSIITTARKANQLEEPNRACLQRNSKALFGIKPEVYGKLRGKKHRFAAWPLLRASWQIASRSDVSICRVVTSPSYLWSARCLTAKSDILTRSLWRACQLMAGIVPAT